MSENIINKARENSVNNRERKRVAKKRKKMINYVTLLLLIASILTNIFLFKKIDFSNPSTFNETTYGEDYDKEFEDTKKLIELCITQCIREQINEDTDNVKNQNGDATNKYAYNFQSEKYKNLLYESILINDYKVSYNKATIIVNKYNNLPEKAKEAIAIHYGKGWVKFDNNKQTFEKMIGTTLTKENIDAKGRAALAERSVNEMVTAYLDNEYGLENTHGKGL